MTAPTVEAAVRLAPLLSERALDNEQRRTIAPDLVEQMRAAGIFHLGMPSELGGLECDPLTIVETIEVLAAADGSAGWTAFIGNSTCFLAWLEPGVAKEIVSARPDLVVASAIAPSGTATPDGADVVIDGRWSFNSGCPHADWFMHGVHVIEGDAPRMLPSGRPDWRWAVYPAREATILDTWHVAGLRATGSHDVVAADVRVPVERTIMPFYEPARFDGALYRLPCATLMATFMSGFVLGVARRALDDFTALTAKKSRALQAGPTMAEDPVVHVELARAEGAVRAARAYVFDSISAAWNAAVAGDDLPMEARGDVWLATLHAARTARAAVDSVFGMAGASALAESSPMQRCARDLAAGTQHLMLSLQQWKAVGRVLCGLDPSTYAL